MFQHPFYWNREYFDRDALNGFARILPYDRGQQLTRCGSVFEPSGHSENYSILARCPDVAASGLAQVISGQPSSSASAR
jgi:hypothetical protein